MIRDTHDIEDMDLNALDTSTEHQLHDGKEEDDDDKNDAALNLLFDPTDLLKSDDHFRRMKT